MNRYKKTAILVCFIVLPIALGFFSSFVSGDLKAIYAGFVKPPLAPPDWLFGIAWTILYVLMGLAAYLAFVADASRYLRQRALAVFGMQLFLNIIWSPVFFGADLLWAAVVIVLLLDATAFCTTILFHRVSSKAAYLMIPYLLWLLFASYLTVGVAMLN